MEDSNASLSLFDVPADAESTNRGFSVQYLDAVREWFDCTGTGRVVYCELYDDVAIDDPITLQREFRQIKSYKSTALGFGDEAVKHSVYLFYRNYVPVINGKPGHDPRFSFVLDGKIRPRDVLLNEWAESGTCPDTATAADVLKRCVEEELEALYSRRKARVKDTARLELVDREYESERAILDKCDFKDFASRLFVEVSDDSVDSRLAKLVAFVATKVNAVVPPELVVARCFQEVALRASDPDPNGRVLTQGTLKSILEEDEQHVLSRLSADNIGKRVISIMTEHGYQLSRIEAKVDAVEQRIGELRSDISEVKDSVRLLGGERETLTFPLIEEVLAWIESYLLQSELLPEDRRPVDDTDAKIEKNKLSDEVAEEIYSAYADFPQVRDFLRLTKGRRERMITSAVKRLYREKRDAGQSADAIFWGLIRDITPHKAGEAKQYACTVLIAYFFHACEVFERVNPRQV